MVVVVLTGAGEALIDELALHDHVSEQALLALEADDWVSRARTYQELVNARRVEFVTKGGAQGPVSGARLFNAVGEAM